jgi:DNA mismatch endonuclease, patch repair protein
MMSGIGGRNTGPEVAIRKALHAKGFRFRIHDRRYPGTPDIVLPKYRALINVNGCFWHGHGCYLFRMPETRTEFWQKKIHENMTRDDRNHVALENTGWRVCIVWECAIKGAFHREYLPDIIRVLSDWLVGSSRYLEFDGGFSGKDVPRFTVYDSGYRKIVKPVTEGLPIGDLNDTPDAAT